MKDNFKIFSGSSHKKLAEETAKMLNTNLGKITIKKFSCGEIYINIDESVRGKDIFLMQTCTQNVNENFLELFLLIDTFRRSFANSVHVIIPHFGYARQDKICSARETISAKLMADLIVCSGANHIITVHLHSDQIQAFFDVPLDNLNPKRIFIKYFKEKVIENAIVISPDVGGAKSAKNFSKEMNLPLAILSKERPMHNKAEISHVIGDIKGKACIIYDDMIDTAGSVCKAYDVLIKNGAKDEIYLCATHPIFSGNAVEKLSATNFQEVVTTNTVPSKEFKSLRKISIAPLFASVIKNTVENKSVSSLYF